MGECANAAHLASKYPPASFDLVLCVQSINTFADPQRFIHGAGQVLRQHGRLILCDLFTKRSLQPILAAIEECGLVCDSLSDLSSAVNAAGICEVIGDRTYMHIVAQKTCQ